MLSAHPQSHSTLISEWDGTEDWQWLISLLFQRQANTGPYRKIFLLSFDLSFLKLYTFPVCVYCYIQRIIDSVLCGKQHFKNFTL